MRTEINREPAFARFFLLVAPILAWGLSWPVMKVGVAAVPPIWFGCLRYCVAFLCLAAVIGMKGRFSTPSRQDWPLILVSGTLQMAAFSSLTGLALTVVPPGRASVLSYSTPLWVVPFAAWRYNEPLGGGKLLGMAAGLVGIAVIAVPSMDGWPAAELCGYAMLLGAAALWAVSILYVRAHRFAGSALDLAPWQMLVASGLLLPVALLTEGPLRKLDYVGALALGYVGPFATALAYWAIVEAGRRFRSSTISMALLATPCLGIFISAFSLKEVIDFRLIAGMILIGGGICLGTGDLSITSRREGMGLP